MAPQETPKETTKETEPEEKAEDDQDQAQDAEAELGVRGWLTLIVLCGAQCLIALDFSIVTVALPAIGRSLGHSSPASLQWVITACMLPTASLLTLFGRTMDIVGRRRQFLLGMGLISAFALMGGLAPNYWMLIAARAGQGVAGAMVGPTALALLTASFPEGPKRTKALGVNGALLSLGFVLGTIGGGVITSGLSWRWTMLIMVIIGGLVFVGGLFLLPRAGSKQTSRQLDVPGAVLGSGGMLALVYGVSMAGDSGWSNWTTITALVAAIVLLFTFYQVEARQRNPLTPVRVLRRRSVKWGGLTGFVTFGMCGGATVLLSLYMQNVLDWNSLDSGLGFLAEGLAALAGGMLVSRITEAIGSPGRTLVAGLIVQAASTTSMLALPLHGNLLLLLATSGVMGFGHVLSVVSFISVMTSGLPSEDEGIGSGLAQTAQFLGSSVGVALLAAVATARTSTLKTAGNSTVVATMGGLHVGLATAGAVCLTGMLVAAVFLARREPGTEEVPAAA